jgi:ABC-type nitrate/sulfonate/bicarbonate transport system permease component
MGWNRWIRAAVNPIFQVLRPIPPIAWIPLAILWFGLGDSARIYVVWLAAVVPWILNSFEAVRSVDSILISAARMLGAGQRTILTDIVAPSAVPVLVAGARISLGNAWTTLIAAELLAASAGLGFVALNARRTLDSDIMLVAMFTIGILGVIFTGLLYLLERAVSRGRVEEVSL